jgi:hypothetical protein
MNSKSKSMVNQSSMAQGKSIRASKGHFNMIGIHAVGKIQLRIVHARDFFARPNSLAR